MMLSAAVLILGCKSSKSVDDPQREQLLGITCEASLTLSGSFAPGAPPPASIVGCWGDGTWSFSAKVVSNQCPHPPQLESQYQMAISHDATNSPQFQYLNDPTNTDTIMRMTAGGGSLCEGELTLFHSSGTVVTTLKPHLYSDGHIDGQGTASTYTTDQR
jgi:hypothetical protein